MAGNAKGISINVLNAVMVGIAVIAVVVFLNAVQRTYNAFEDLENASSSYIACEEAATNMEEASDYLTNQVRLFVVTRDVEHLELYLNESHNTGRREAAIATLEEYLAGMDAHRYLEQARELSVELEQREMYAMKLVCVACGYPEAESIESLAVVKLSDKDAALSAEEQIDTAMGLVFDETYQSYDARINENVLLSKTYLLGSIEAVQADSTAQMRSMLMRQRIVAWASLAIVVLMAVLLTIFVLRPLYTWVRRIKANEQLPMTGAYEMRFLAGAYNEMLEENNRSHAQLRRKAEHDALTGLYNRGAFEELLRVSSEKDMALLLVDVDHFKEVNDTYGHDVGDRILKKLADLLGTTFRSSDYPCRIGGDEFAVIMTGVSAKHKSVIRAKVEAISKAFGEAEEGVPAATLSIGIAFAQDGEGMEALFKAADNALYHVKEDGRNGWAFFDETAAAEEAEGEEAGEAAESSEAGKAEETGEPDGAEELEEREGAVAAEDFAAL